MAILTLPMLTLRRLCRAVVCLPPSGKVIKWVPSDGSPIRGLLRTLKADVAPVPLPVYPVVVKTDGNVMVRLS